MAATSPATTLVEDQNVDNDALRSLEERILRAVDLVAQLRKEKDAALTSIENLKAENAKLSDELDSLQSERKQVRSRIEKLLGQMDTIAS